MNIEVRSKGIPVDKDVPHFVKCRSYLAFTGLEDQIGLVSVFVSRTGAAGGGSEIRCMALVRLHGQREVVIEGAHANLYVAIHQTLDEAGWATAKTLMRRQSGLIQQQLALIESQIAQFETAAPPLTDRAA